MLPYPTPTHRLHVFEYEGRCYVADLDCRGKILEIDPLISEILRLCADNSEQQIATQLSNEYTPEAIEQAFSALEQIGHTGLLFSLDGDHRDEEASSKDRPQILIPQAGGHWFSDIRQMAAGTNVTLFHMIESLAKYADLHVTGREAKQITDGIYEVPFDFSPETVRCWPFTDYDGILACLTTHAYELLPLFHFADVPIVMQHYSLRGHGGDFINAALLYYSAMRDFDAFVTATDSVARFYSRFVADTSLFHTVPLGVDLDLFRPMDTCIAKQQMAQALQDTRLLEQPVAGFLSRFMPEKGASIFLQLAEMNPDILFLIGAKSLTTYTLRDLPRNVLYAGFQPREQLPVLYSAFDVFCFPSMSGEESFGLAVLEAMACGTPPIVPDFDGVPEVVGDAGLLVEAEEFGVEIGSFASYVSPLSFSEKLNFLLQNDAERLRLGKRVRERALGFTWDATARKLLTLFEQLRRKKALVKRRNLSVLFAKALDRSKGTLKGRSLLLNVNEREENPLMRGAYPQSMEEGLALALLQKHTLRELEALLSHLIQDEAKALNILRRVEGFANALV